MQVICERTHTLPFAVPDITLEQLADVFSAEKPATILYMRERSTTIAIVAQAPNLYRLRGSEPEFFETLKAQIATLYESRGESADIFEP